MNTITKGSGWIAAWKALAVHQKTIKKLHLRKLFVEDSGRGEKLKASAAGLFLEYSKNRSTNKTTQLLLQPGDLTEVWRRGSVVASWLRDLTASSLIEDQELARFGGHVSDSNEGRWTIKTAIHKAVSVPVLSAAVHQRFSSRGKGDYQDKLLSGMRFGFGGHLEKTDK